MGAPRKRWGIVFPYKTIPPPEIAFGIFWHLPLHKGGFGANLQHPNKSNFEAREAKPFTYDIAIEVVGMVMFARTHTVRPYKATTNFTVL